MAGSRQSASVIAVIVFSCLAAAASASFAAPAAGGGVRVALYVGGGATAPSFANYSLALAQLAAAGDIASFAELQAADIDGGRLSAADFDVLLVPGGMSTTESAAVGAVGLANIVQFVALGGGYVGVCAGAYLAFTAECCDRAVPGYCGNATGCLKTPWSLGLAPLASADPWDRGHGLVNISFSAAAVAALRLPYAAGANVSIMYWQGPILDRAWRGALPGVNFESLATYESEIHADWPDYTTGACTLDLTPPTARTSRQLTLAPNPASTTA